MEIPYLEKEPSVAEDAYIAPGAMLIGPVSVGRRSTIWFNAVLRADRGEIIVGEETSIQDCSVLHGPVSVGSYVTVGHGVILHGAVIEDNVIVGMNSVVLDDARIGHGSIVAAGAVVPERMEVPPHSLVAGVPAKIIKQLPEEQEQGIRAIAVSYYAFAEPHMESK
jgi:carbonic anhydrase/acetyltransferase-like protein (isoleucine patch superfamily)